MTDAKEGPWILNCNYCMWTSLDIGITFRKPTNIRSQLDKIANGGKPKQPSKQTDYSDPSRKSSLVREALSTSSTNDSKSTSQPEATDPETPLDPNARFAALRSFYKTQIALSSDTESATTLPSAADLTYSSPSSLTRLLNIYTVHGAANPSKKPKSRVPIMREALTPAEGLLVPPQDSFRSPTPTTTTTTHLGDTASLAQRSFQQSGSGSGTPHARLVSDLRPMPVLLRTKRAKRCAACKHILARPEHKHTSIRYRIKLTALSYIPLVTLRPMPGGAGNATSASSGGGAHGESGPGGGGGGGGGGLLQPQRPYQWIVTLKNHLFDTVKVSLGTPAVTPGRRGHKVTVLCPQFEIGPNGEVWDDALGGDKKRSSVAAASSGLRGDAGVAEAGKVYDKGRNWTSVVLEVVPLGAWKQKSVVEVRERGFGEVKEQEATEVADVEEENEDDDVVEIPIRVRLEWRQSDAEEGDDGKKKTPTVNEEGEVVDEAKRELAYWMVLGVGRVGS